eukprot:g3381.t1
MNGTSMVEPKEKEDVNNDNNIIGIEENEDEKEPGYCSLLFYFWLIPLLVLGFKLQLKPQHMPKLFRRFQSKKNAKAIDNSIEEHKAKGNGNPKIDVRSLLYRSGSSYWTVGIFFAFCQGFLNCLGRPLTLKLVIDAALPDSGYSVVQIILVTILFGVVIFAEGLCMVTGRQILTSEFATYGMSFLVPLIHAKSMKISSGARAIEEKESSPKKKKNDSATATSTNESTLIGTDLITGFELFKWACLLPQNVFGLIAGLIALALLLGVPCLVGICLMLIILACNYRFAQWTALQNKSELAKTDDRISTMKEILTGIQQVKYGAFEEEYFDLVEEHRYEETGHMLKARLYQIVSMTMGRGSPILAGCATFVFMSLTGYPLEASSVFASLAAYNSLRMPLIMLPQNIIQFFNLFITSQRMSSFLNLDEQKNVNSIKDDQPGIINVTNATIGWGKPEDSGKEKPIDNDGNDGTSLERFRLTNVNFELDAEKTDAKKYLTAVVGKVGTGKSTFLSALIGATNIDKGEITTTEDIAYVPQKAFVLSGTILENILMGREKNDAHLEEALEGSAFKADLELLAGGLKCEIGERGTTLSGGQQMRLCLARALYGQPKLLLIDDALAAVDGKVANIIFNKGFLARKGKKLFTLIVINQIQYLKKFDHILYLEDGIIQKQGTFQEVYEECESFNNFVSSSKAAASGNVDDLKLQSQSSFGTRTRSSSIGSETKNVDATISGPENSKAVKLVKDEKVHTGFVSGANTLAPYFNGLGGYWFFAGAVFLSLIAYSLMAINDLWLASWIGDIKKLDAAGNLHRALVYIAFSLSHAVGVFMLAAFNAFSTTRAARAIHRNTLKRILHAPLSWFQSVPSGRILARFSGDLSICDKFLAFITDDAFHFFVLNLALLVVIGYIVPFIIPVLAISVFVYFGQVISVDRTNREVKRMTVKALSPVLTLVQESVNGRETIKAMQLEEYFKNKMYKYIDEWNRYNYLSATVVNAGYLYCNVLAFFISVSSASVVLFNRDSFQNPAMIGVALGYSFLLPYFFGILSLIWSLGMQSLTSLERVLEYQGPSVPQDPDWYKEEDKLLEKVSWPQNGSLVFTDASLRYRPDLPLAMKKVNLQIKGGEKVGIVGRTVDTCAGTIMLDDVNIRSVGLQKLRKAISIIPQHCLMLEGNIRHNLDPFSRFDSKDLVDVLVRVGLCDTPSKAKEFLDVEISGGSGATGLSAGQQQLMTIARALLQGGGSAKDGVRSQIIVMDEPTANVDWKTDEAIQGAIRDVFRESTVLVIAHRLNTVIDFDKLIVMDKGRVAEFGSPIELMEKKSGLLHEMISSMDEQSAKALREKAEAASQIISTEVDIKIT